MSHDSPTRNALSRRTLLRGVGAVGVGSVGMALGESSLTARADDPAHPAPTSREAFDQLDMSINNGNAVKDETNDKDSSGLSGKLAWREAYALEGYALMYQAHRDTYYLDKMVDHIDHVLANRDSERGVTDYAGNSHPAWRADHLYTIGFVTVPDTTGRPAFEVRSALSYGDLTTVTISAGTAEGSFRLEAYNAFHKRTTIYEDLSTDPTSPNYALRRMVEGFRRESPNRVLLTIRDLRDDPTAGDIAQGQFTMVSAPYVYGAHTGAIVHPMALFARLVREDRGLMANPTYRQRAELYIEAVADALAVHDPEWRQNSEGEGYYVAQAGAPVWNAGFDNAIGHFTPMGRAIVQMARVTGDRLYVDRANAMGWTVRNAMVVDGDAWIWPSWWQKGAPYNGWDIDNPRSEFWPWYPPNRIIKNTSHAQWDLNFARDLHLANLSPGEPPFGVREMQRFTATYTDNMMATREDGTASVYKLVDGSRGIGTRGQEQMSTAWAELGIWDTRVLTNSVAILENHMDLGRLGFESALYCLARVNHASTLCLKGKEAGWTCPTR